MIKQPVLGFVAGFVCLGIAFWQGGPWFLAHGALMVLGGLVPLLCLFHVHALKRFAGVAFPAKRLENTMWAALASAAALAAGILSSNEWVSTIALIIGFVATVEYVHLVLPQIPRTTLISADPLTKGDDACMRQMRMAHYFLPTGFYWMALGAVPVDIPLLSHIFVAGIHELLIGFGLVSMYSLGHLWVPRLSGIPAIAAGAIKGELHTTMLGIAGVTLGFLTGRIGFFLAFAPFVFIGFFTYMGVLGANIMKNKSQTHRVTPEYVYVPWVFSAVFWMICGVLMGLFLNVVPDTLQEKFGGLRYLHIHVGLAAGMLQMLLGLATRILSERWGQAPPRFAGLMKGSFYLFNAAIALALWAHLAHGRGSAWLAAAAGFFVLSLFMYVQAMVQKRPAPSN